MLSEDKRLCPVTDIDRKCAQLLLIVAARPEALGAKAANPMKTRGCETSTNGRAPAIGIVCTDGIVRLQDYRCILLHPDKCGNADADACLQGEQQSRAGTASHLAQLQI